MTELGLLLAVIFFAGLVAGYVLGRLAIPSSPSEAPVRLEFHIGPNAEVRTDMQLKDSQKFDMSVTATDAKGAPTQVENAMFAVSDAGLGTIDVDPSDPTKATFTAGSPGSGQISFSADPVGPNDTPLVASLDIEVLPGDATVLQINTGAVVDQ